jgi:hypothetical protein
MLLPNPHVMQQMNAEDLMQQMNAAAASRRPGYGLLIFLGPGGSVSPMLQMPVYMFGEDLAAGTGFFRGGLCLPPTPQQACSRRRHQRGHPRPAGGDTSRGGAVRRVPAGLPRRREAPGDATNTASLSGSAVASSALSAATSCPPRRTRSRLLAS